MSANGEQIYCCTVCAIPRRFGNGFPDDVAEIFQLNCSYCGKVTPHKFMKMEFGPDEPSTRGGFRPGAGRKPATRSNAHA